MTSMKILVVEDESIVALDIESQLSQLGHEVVGPFNRGETALDAVRMSPPDLILMDIRLQGQLDGIETSRQIKAQIDLPIVFLTAYTDHDTLKRAQEAAPFGYLIKPFEVSELREIIDSFSSTTGQDYDPQPGVA